MSLSSQIKINLEKINKKKLHDVISIVSLQ